MDPRLTRRGLLLGGMGLVLAACGNRTTTSAPSRPPRVASRGMWYQVQRGDTLSSISRRSGVGVTRIVAENQLDTITIHPGDRLFLPDATEILANDPLHQPEPVVATGRYRLVSRSAWTSDGVRANHDPMNGINRITLHHTVEHGTRGEDLLVVQRIAHHHRENLGWADIGYHYLIGTDGRVFEGRPTHIQGAHSGGVNNRHNLGVSAIGDFQAALPSPQQLACIESFLEDMRRRYRVPKSQVFGHRDLGNTLCPGDALYGWLQQYKRTATATATA